MDERDLEIRESCLSRIEHCRLRSAPGKEGMDEHAHLIDNACCKEHTVERPPAVDADSLNSILEALHPEGPPHINPVFAGNNRRNFLLFEVGKIILRGRG